MAANLIQVFRQLVGVPEVTQHGLQLAHDDEKTAELIRRNMGGQLQPLAVTRTRWYLNDLESASQQADNGQLALAGQLHRAMRRDGTIDGLMSTRTSGLVALQKRYRGDRAQTDALRAENGTRSVFDEMFPPSELARLAADGVGLGVGVGEMLDVEGRDYPVFARLDPEFLTYRWSENRWYFRSVSGLLPVTPGDGRWILHTPGGKSAPWQHGRWHALGRAFITKEHAIMHRANFSAKLANPARVASAPSGATEEQNQSMLSQLMAWGINSVFSLPVGWEARLLESNGRGYEVFGQEIETAGLEIMIALAGQIVTVTGGAGFSNADIHKTIRADLIKDTGDALAHTINTQGLPRFIFKRWGREGFKNPARVGWDTDPPKDRKAEAELVSAVGKAIRDIRPELKETNLDLDVDELVDRLGIPVVKSKISQEAKLELAPTDLAKVILVDEARAAAGLGPIGDKRGSMTVHELAEDAVSATLPGDASADSEASEASEDDGAAPGSNDAATAGDEPATVPD